MGRLVLLKLTKDVIPNLLWKESKRNDTPGSMCPSLEISPAHPPCSHPIRTSPLVTQVHSLEKVDELVGFRFKSPANASHTWVKQIFF